MNTVGIVLKKKSGPAKAGPAATPPVMSRPTAAAYLFIYEGRANRPLFDSRTVPPIPCETKNLILCIRERRKGCIEAGYAKGCFCSPGCMEYCYREEEPTLIWIQAAQSFVPRLSYHTILWWSPFGENMLISKGTEIMTE